MSPTSTSVSVLMEAVMYPTSPASSASVGIRLLGPMLPTSTTLNTLPVAIRRISSPGRTCPSITRMYTMTPFVAVVHTVEDQRLERRLPVPPQGQGCR